MITLKLSGNMRSCEPTFVITKWTKQISDSGFDEVIAEKPADMDYKFRLLDDDGIVYAYGYSMTNDDDEAFYPLDQYAGDYGCTEIQYNNMGKWETL